MSKPISLILFPTNTGFSEVAELGQILYDSWAAGKIPTIGLLGLLGFVGLLEVLELLELLVLQDCSAIK